MGLGVPAAALVGCDRQTVPPVAATQPAIPMEQATELAGVFAAHAVWSVSTGETLTTIAAYETADGKRTMKRLVADRNEESVAHGKHWLANNPDHAARAVLIYDGFLTRPGSRTDALIVTARDFMQGDAEVSIAIPYRSATDAKGFAVHRPKFLGFKGPEPDSQKLAEALWRGIASHSKGAEVWNKHLDESK
jgi:hypothetical protein